MFLLFFAIAASRSPNTSTQRKACEYQWIVTLVAIAGAAILVLYPVT